MIDEYNEWLNEGDDLSSADIKVVKRLWYKKIMTAKNKKELDRIYKSIEKHQDLVKQGKRLKGYSNDEIDIIKGWFDEAMSQMKMTESYSFDFLSEAPIAAKGWDSSSVEKFGKTIGKSPTDKGFFDACVARMSNKEGFDEQKAKGFCASIKDRAYGDPHWRGKGKTKSQVKKDTAGKEYEKK